MTITETIMTIAIFIVVLIGVVGAILGLYRAHSYSFQQVQAIGEAREGIAKMVKEIREARPGDDGSYIIEQADDFQFIFYGDVDKDGVTERIRYFIENNYFKKEEIDPSGHPPIYITNPAIPEYIGKTTIISSYVRNAPPVFRYFDGSLTELPAPARLQDTKLMRLYLVINVDPSQTPGDFVLESDVQLRNLKINL